MQDMTDEERSIMQDHIAYWEPYVENGTVKVMGPVSDPAGGFGLAIVSVENLEEIDSLIGLDPANALGTYDVFPMRAVTKK